ncbi:MAG TPA: AgmX/PglI C-terminal domain-containing protein [bacterium]|nr:AgmX/PglI C-terminal domain-containing protein [bacterium]
MKFNLFLTVFFFLLLFILISCSSSPSSRRSSENEGSPEIGVAEMTGGERVAVRGYSKDSELNKKMQMIDLEIIDCYKQFVPIGKVSENTINFELVVDISGFIEKTRINGNNPDSQKIGNCISKDLDTLSFRPGEEREISYRLVFKPIEKSKNVKSNDPRSKMIMSLSDMKKFKKCYEDQIASTPGIGGNFSIRFIVDEEGNVKDIKITASTFSNNTVPLCVVKKLADTIFPESESEDNVEVNFKFKSNAPVKMRKSMDIDM